MQTSLYLESPSKQNLEHASRYLRNENPESKLGSLVTPAETIARIFAGSESFLSPVAYGSALPPFVRDWHVHLTDRGHCIMCLIEGQFDYFPADNLWKNLVAVPVITVLREYNIHAGMIVVRANN